MFGQTPADVDLLNRLVKTDIRDSIPKSDLDKAYENKPFQESHGFTNLRIAGTVPGSELYERRFWRAGLLGRPNDRELAGWKADRHTYSCFDLRSAEEGGDTGPKPENKHYTIELWLPPSKDYEVKIPTDKFISPEVAAAYWKKQYLAIALNYRAAFRKALEYILKDHATHPIIIYCRYGRDATSVFMALLNHLVGSKPEVALFDYMLSRIGLEGDREDYLEIARREAKVTSLEESGFYNILQIRPEYWNGFIEALNERFGGWDGYIRSADGLNFSEKDVEEFRIILHLERWTERDQKERKVWLENLRS